MLEIITWIMFGALVGWIASLITRSHIQLEIKQHIYTGIVGAIVGGMVIKIFDTVTTPRSQLIAAIAALLGSIIFTVLFRVARKHIN